MKQSNGFRIILTAMLAALICVSTLCIQIPSPVGGYINAGDAFVLMSGFMLGTIYGSAAAGIGSALADVLTGYMHYAPGTLILKALTALIASLICTRLSRRKPSMHLRLRFALAGVPAEMLMILGYLAYAWWPLSHGAGALASVPGNIVQAAAGILISTLLTPLVLRPREIQEMLEKFHQH